MRRIAAGVALAKYAHSSARGLEGLSHACSRCHVLIAPETTRCLDCGTPRPDDGWPHLTELPPDPFLGKVIDSRYLVTKPIGFGASGEVYRAESLVIPRRFAVKFVKISGEPSSKRANEVRERIRREVDAVLGLRNPNVVRIYDLIEIGPRFLAIVMGYIDGRTLLREIESAQGIGVARTVAVGRQLASALCEAHQHGLIHRDVKPDNVMVERLPDGSDFAHLLDFGIVWARGASHLTEGFIGTPLYASPEQARGSDVDHRSDIYSLGATLFHAGCGTPPFEASTPMALLRQHVREIRPALTDRMGSQPGGRELSDLLQKMMAIDPADRLSDMKHVIAELDAIHRSEGSEATVVSASVSPGAVVSSCGECAPQPTVTGREGSDVPCMSKVAMDSVHDTSLMRFGSGRIVTISAKGVVGWTHPGWDLEVSEIARLDAVNDIAGSSVAVWLASDRGLFRTDGEGELQLVRDTPCLSVSSDRREWFVSATDHRGQLWFRASYQGQPWRRLELDFAALSTHVAPDGSHFAFCGEQEVQIRSVAEPARVVATLAQQGVERVAFSNDGYLIATLDERGRVDIFSTSTGQHVVQYPDFVAPVRDIAFSRGDTLMALCSGDDGVFLLDLQCPDAVQCAPGDTMCHRH